MSERRVVAIVTGSRADYGLLDPVMRAVRDHPELALRVYVAGSHLLPPDHTGNGVAACFEIAATIPMQEPGATGRHADAAAVARGMTGFARCFARDRPDFVLVLGDRIEAFAAAACASVAGLPLAHMHGGDRAEGIADEALRHAITKLAHIHLPATDDSAARIIRMGEDPARTHVVGSPAIDDLASIGLLGDDAYDALGRPEIVLLMHPSGGDDATERARARCLLELCADAGRTLALDPNFDAGRDGIVAALDEATRVQRRSHLDRPAFIGLLRRVRVIAGNSSAGLIECAALPVRCVNIGTRQAGRLMPEHVINCPDTAENAIRAALTRGLTEPIAQFRHPYGDGRSGPRTADVLASADSDNHPLAKRNSY